MTRAEGSGTAGVDPRELWLTPDPDRPRRGRRPAFSREAITVAAVALADAEGIDAVTMRRVAAEVGAGVMSLYSYAPDKETLLDLMIDHVNGELSGAGTLDGEPSEAGPLDGEPSGTGTLNGEPSAPPPLTREPSGAGPLTREPSGTGTLPREPSAPPPLTGDWRADLKAIGHLQRDHMLRHPWLATAVPARRTLGPRTLAFLEHALAALRPSGLDGGARLEVFAQLTAFVAGHVAHEVAQAEAALSPDRAEAEVLYLTAVAADGRHPELAEALASAGRPVTPDATFARFLNRLVDGLDAG
ncbi:TetR/AcrR family transcriptional regulator [Streptomyces sp. NPDC005773]|uniref:TetR/AcrR family transcriptional regulator n=1 Tax=Streptomyces sp. NPDC005773 TaxID=3364727 RepID=UPI0036C33BD2